jgi:NADH-quinone oxidoreductase subunit M
MIYERYHTRDMDKLGGLARQMPIMTFFLILFVLSSVGLPGLNGFVSEFTVLFAAYNSPTLGPIFGVFGATGILLGAIYMLYMAGKVLFGPVKEPPGTPDASAGLTPDLNGREIAILTPLAIVVVLLGVYPRLITETLDPALETQVMQRVTAAIESSDAPPVAESDGDNVIRCEGDKELACGVGPSSAAPYHLVALSPYHSATQGAP